MIISKLRCELVVKIASQEMIDKEKQYQFKQ